MQQQRNNGNDEVKTVFVAYDFLWSSITDDSSTAGVRVRREDRCVLQWTTRLTECLVVRASRKRDGGACAL